MRMGTMTKEQKASITRAAIKVEIEVLSLTPGTKAAPALKEYLETAGTDSLVRLYEILRLA